MPGVERQAIESFKRAFKMKAEDKLWKPRWDLPSGCLSMFQTQSRLAEVVGAIDEFEGDISPKGLQELITVIGRVRGNVSDQSTYVDALDQLKESLVLWQQVAIDLHALESSEGVDVELVERLLKPDNLRMLEKWRPNNIEALQLQLKSLIPESSIPEPTESIEDNKELLKVVIDRTAKNSTKWEAVLAQDETQINDKDLVEAFHTAMTPITDADDPRYLVRNGSALKTCYNFANALRTELFGSGHTDIRGTTVSTETFSATDRDDFLSKAAEANLTPGTILTFGNVPQVHTTTVVKVTGDILVADVHPANPKPSLKKLGALYDEFALQVGTVEEGEIKKTLKDLYATPTIGVFRPPT